ncbi:MAG: hypothetical protein N3H30_01000 [Candidatus Micrarchaeota archaeon]|nr:hypothetical protein [Candidatus Micrarchaeota archaeon]
MAVAIDLAGYMQWLPIALLLFAIAYLAIGIFYMIAKAFQKPEWEARAKTEFARMLVSLIMLIVIAGFAATLGLAVDALTEGNDPFEASKTYLSKFSLGSGKYESIPYNVNVLWAAAKDMRSKATIISPMPTCIGGACFTQYAGWIYVAGHLESIASITIPFAASIVVQILALDFIERFFLALLLPAGFILKVLPATRDAGAYLISLSLAFYFVFPMVYVVGERVHATAGKAFIKQLEDAVRADVEPSTSYGRVFDETQRYGCDGCSAAMLAITRLAYISPYAVTLPLLAVILSLAAARSLFPIFSRDFIGEVGM